jgi:hypothetical protein
MMRLDRRFLIVMIPLLTIGAIYFWASIIPPRWERRPFILSFNVMALLAGLVWAAQTPINFVQGRPQSDNTVIQASNVLHAAGMGNASEVLSTHMRLQDAAAPGRDRFPQAYWVAADVKSVADVVQAMRVHGWRFFIYDRETGATIFPSLESLLSPEARPADLSPIYFPEDRQFVIYRLSESKNCSPVGAHFENGIILDCYEAHVSRDVPAGSSRRVAVYLNWRAESRLDVSHKVFVHVLNAEGRLVAQNDGIPALWTYPTSEWKAGEAIVDFHQFEMDASLPPGNYTLQTGLYDPESGARLAAGAQDHVVLTKITIQ